MMSAAWLAHAIKALQDSTFCSFCRDVGSIRRQSKFFFCLFILLNENIQYYTIQNDIYLTNRAAEAAFIDQLLI